MPAPAKTADEIADNIKQLIDRVVDAKFTQEMAKRGQDMAGLIAERGAEVGEIASEAWRESKPIRRDAAKRLARATDDATKWSDQTWRKAIRPMVRDLWKRRTLALGAAGAAVPAGREIVDTAAVRLGLKQQREERHWGAFFLGLLIGAAAGAIAALLTTPKRGEEMRHELSVKADEVRQEIATRADDLAEKAKDAEWVPIFQREGGNGHATEAAEMLGDSTGSVQEAAAEGGAAVSDAADEAASDAAEAINESFDTVDREA
jgi:gas vesicle protein